MARQLETIEYHHFRILSNCFLSVLLWGDKMRNQRITFFTDNAALVDIINKSTSWDVIVMIFVRRLVLACLKFNILFRLAMFLGSKIF